jgi:hypothetical protein
MKKFGFLLLFTVLAVFCIHATPVTTSTESSVKDSLYQAYKNDQTINDEQSREIASEQFYENEKKRSYDNDEPKLTSAGIVLISLMPFLTAILIVFFVVRNKRMKELRMIQLYEKALEAGKDLPESFFRRPDEEPKSHFLKGLIWIGTGLGVSVGALYLMGEHSPWGFGLIPLFIGIAYLISYFVEKKDKANSAKDE